MGHQHVAVFDLEWHADQIIRQQVVGDVEIAAVPHDRGGAGEMETRGDADSRFPHGARVTGDPGRLADSCKLLGAYDPPRLHDLDADDIRGLGFHNLESLFQAQDALVGHNRHIEGLRQRDHAVQVPTFHRLFDERRIVFLQLAA